MGKVTPYLKHFFMLDESTSYEVQTYKDYSGPGFGQYKRSPYFKRPGIKASPGYLKSEVAAFSEMTKIALLVGMVILVLIVVLWDFTYIKILASGDFDLGLFLWASILTLLLTVNGLGMYPRIVFLLKNFRIARK